MRTPLEYALLSEGLGIFYVDLRFSQSFIHAAPSFIFFTELIFLQYLGINCKRNYQQRIFKYWCEENGFEKHFVTFAVFLRLWGSTLCCKVE